MDEFIQQILREKRPLIITPNQRLARFLLCAIEAEYKQSQKRWNTPQIVPLEFYFHHLWSALEARGITGKQLISDSQALLHWKNLLSNTPIEPPLLKVHETARNLYDAYKLAIRHQIELSDNRVSETPDGYFFVQMATLFEAKLSDKALLVAAQLPEAVLAFKNDIQSELPKHISLYGFDELPPNINAFFAATDVISDFIPLHEHTASVSLATCNTFEDELVLAAQWAKSKVSQQPKGAIGVVVAELEKKRDTVERLFANVFEPENAITLDVPDKVLFNISAGRALYHYPLIHTALMLLEALNKPLSLKKMHHILLSSFLVQADEDVHARSLFDLYLKEAGRDTLHWHELISAAREFNQQQSIELGQLIDQLDAAHKLYEEFPNKATLSVWAQGFSQFLQTVGWPGCRVLSSVEYQVVERFKDLFIEFSAVDDEAYGYNEAIEILIDACTHTIFQEQTATAPVQILGPLEAAGLAFDALFITQMTNETWPAKANPNPFIPFELQKKLMMPRCSPEKELEYAENLLHQFKALSKELVVSHALLDGEKPLFLSPLIDTSVCAPFDSDAHDYEHNWLEQSLSDHKPALVPFSDCFGFELREQDTYRGGASLIKSQSVCPFQAYARYRLNVKSIPEVSESISKLDRGNLLHVSLYNIWSDLCDSDALLNMSQNSLEQLVDNAVHDAIQKYLGEAYIKRNRIYTEIEHTCVRTIIIAWLTKEKARAPFRIAGLEKRVSLQLKTLNLSLQIDRIDKLDDGSTLIIDYKTGKVDANAWFDERPSEPQLPLYGLINIGGSNSGLAFAEILSGEQTFKGISQNDLNLTGVVPYDKHRYAKQFQSWQDLLNNWQHNLENLAEEFHKGCAKVEPKSPVVCQYCDLQLLCRINEEAS